MRKLVVGHEDDSEAQLALARLLVRTGNVEEASVVADRSYEIDPGNARTAVLRARLRQSGDDFEGAFSVLEEFLANAPESGTVRMTYARMLVDAKRYEEARTEFEYLVAEQPGNDDARYALGLLLVQTNRLDEATEQFERLASRDSRRDAAHYYLARIAESQQRTADAIASYRRVRRGEHRLNAQIRVAVLLADSGDVEAALTSSARSAQRDRPAKRFASTAPRQGLLTRVARYDEAMDVYNASLEAFPGNSDLLYARGMLAVKMDRLDILERDMRAIILREPDNADALNALGYTLADRTDRYEEGVCAHQTRNRAQARRSLHRRFPGVDSPSPGATPGGPRATPPGDVHQPRPRDCGPPRRGALGAGQQGRGACRVEHRARVGTRRRATARRHGALRAPRARGHASHA